MTRSIWKWSDDTDATLQDCFASTDWKMFPGFIQWHWGVYHLSHQLNQYVHRRRRLHSDCTSYRNQKPWITGNMCSELKNYHGPNTPRQLWRGHDNTFSPSGDWKDFAWVPKKLYSCTIESITAWYGNWSASDRKVLQSVVQSAQYITGAKLPATQDLHTCRCQRKAQTIVRLKSPKA